MVKSYILTALRNALRHKGYSLINITGLAIGIACCLIILVFVDNELSYDTMHSKKDNMYRIAMIANSNGNELRYPSIGGGVAPAMKRDFPEVIEVCRLLSNNQLFIRVNDLQFEEQKYFFSDSTFFDLFDFALVRGDRNSALKEPFTVVLTEKLAQKYFGTIDVLGRSIEIDQGNQVQTVTVSAVMEDVPENSHFHPEALFPIETIVRLNQDNPNNLGFLDNFTFTAFYSYILLSEGADPTVIEAQMPEFLVRYTNEQQRDWVRGLYLQHFPEIHLTSHLLNEMETNGDKTYVYIFIAVAFLTLVVACINFMNLATARSANRAREVGIRKVSGAFRSSLAVQFLCESMVIALISLGFAIILAELTLPLFNELLSKSLTIQYGFGSPVLPGLLLVVLFVGFFAGSYPAVYLSGFRPVEVLKGKIQAGAKSSVFRKVFVISQFAVSIAFIISSSIVYMQLDYIMNTDLGFNKENRIVIPVPINNGNDRMQKMELLKKEFQNIPGIASVSKSLSVPGQLRAISYIRPEGVADEEALQLASVAVDFDYVSTLGIDIIDGRDFSMQFPTDSTRAFLLNEKAIHDLGVDNPVGLSIDWIQGNFGPAGQERQIIRSGEIIGVFRNMHYEPFRRNIEPMFLYIGTAQPRTLVLNMATEDVMGTIGALERSWNTIVTNRPFDYTFLEDTMQQLYVGEEQLGSIVGYFTVLAIFIACLGLFGLASFMAEQRTKEIGIRKVLGASEPGIIALLSREFLKLVMISNIIAWPIAYAAGRYWLQGFVYRIDIGVWVFLASSVAALLISQVTVTWQAVKAANTNPVNALKYE